MPRARNPHRDRAYELWNESGRTRLLKGIAEELGESETLVRKWKCQDKWSERKGNVTKDAKGNVTKNVVLRKGQKVKQTNKGALRKK